MFKNIYFFLNPGNVFTHLLSWHYGFEKYLAKQNPGNVFTHLLSWNYGFERHLAKTK